MKENVLDVLMYLFENYIDEDDDTQPDRQHLQDALLEAGFPGSQINKAFNWLENLGEPDTRVETPETDNALRIYTDLEMRRLDAASRGFILSLEQNRVLTSTTRELVISRVLELEDDHIGLEEIKWVTLMVMFNQPEQEISHAWLEQMILDNPPEYLH